MILGASSLVFMGAFVALSPSLVQIGGMFVIDVEKMIADPEAIDPRILSGCRHRRDSLFQRRPTYIR
jgi:hypothetical protein